MAFQICFLQEPDFASKQIILGGGEEVCVFQKRLKTFRILPFSVNQTIFF